MLKSLSRWIIPLWIASFICPGIALAGPVIQHWKTPSGTPVYFVSSRDLPMLDVRIDFAAGSAYDPAGKAGLAALTHSLLDLGAGADDEASIARKFADIGAQLSGSVDADRASLSLRTLSDNDKMPVAMALLRQILAAPHFDDKVLERERTRTITELEDALTRPDTQVNRAFWQTLYSGHPYGQITEADSLRNLSRDDVQTFFRQRYTRNNAVISLVGDLDRAHAEKMAERLSAALAADFSSTTDTIGKVTPNLGKVVRISHPASQAHILLGLPTIPRGDPDFFPLIVGNYTLGGGGFVSRLMREVREKRGYAYSVYSYFAPMREAGPFQIGLQTKKDQAADALKLAQEVLTQFIAQGPTDQELSAAKANLVGSFPLRLDSNKKLIDNIAVIGFYRLPLDWLDNYQNRISQVTASEIRQAFARHISADRLNTIIVGGKE